MRRLKISEIVEFTNGNLKIGDNSLDIGNICIDSREVNTDSLFIPIIGENFDGHIFMEKAYENGCRNFLCDVNHDFNHDDINLVVVSDTTLALGDIARCYKKDYDIPYVAVTGSVGKTSTKDIISSVLGSKYNVLKTMGNFNNNIGLPRTLLNLSDSYEIGVIEMGMDKALELDYLSKIVNPDVAVITNIGMSHIMNFPNGQDGIFEAKMEIVNGLKKGGLLIVNGDDKYLSTLKESNHEYKLLTYGFNSNNDIYVKSYEIGDSSSKFVCVYDNREYEFEVSSIAKHNIGNALIAILIGFHFGLSVSEISKGLLNLEFSKNRLDIFDTDRFKIINDTYNASYDSIMSALEVLNSFSGRKVAILGDILELGSYSESTHKKIGDNIKCDLLITIGNDSKYISDRALERGIKSFHFNFKDEFYKECFSLLNDGDVILVKASNGLKLFEVVDYLR